MKSHIALFLVLALSPSLHAAPRASASYALPAETLDSGGGRATSASFTLDSSTGPAGGIAISTAAPAVTAKIGYPGQLYEVTGLTLAATPTTLDEGGTRQLTGSATLDDATTLALAPAEIGWSVLSGPIESITQAGLASARIVFQDTAAAVLGSFRSQTGMLNLTVLNIGTDDFRSYAGDGLDDDWQVQYFGEENPDAAPGIDADGDGQNNRFEFAAGIIPTDPASRFNLQIANVPGQPAQKALLFAPRLDGRTYTVQFRAGLTSGNWQPLTGTMRSDAGPQRTVIDLNAAGNSKFYQVQISRP